MKIRESKTIDAEEFLSWLDEAEEELKSERRKDDQTDKQDEGILVATGIIREYVEKMCQITETKTEMNKKKVEK